MKPRALVVEDDPSIHKLLKPKFVALRHDFEIATNLEEARAKWEKGTFDYGILDLTIPADGDGDFPDKQYGLILIKEIRATKKKEAFPLIAMTSYAEDGLGLSMDLYDLGINQCIAKNPEQMQRLVSTITSVLEKKQAAESTIGAPGVKLTSFGAEPRELVIHPDHVELCGIRVWNYTTSDDVRQVLIRLSEKDKNGFVHVSGSVLMKMLGRNASNPIARVIADFRTRTAELLLSQRNLRCTGEDIIANHRGYHFTPIMKVRIVKTPSGSQAHEPANEPDEPSEPDEPDETLNERQKWILSELAKGTQLKLKDIVRHTRMNRSTINRDLKRLREHKLVRLHEDGHYVKA